MSDIITAVQIIGAASFIFVAPYAIGAVIGVYLMKFIGWMAK